MLICLFILTINSSIAQIDVQFSASFLNKTFELNQDYAIQQDTFHFDNLKFYIAGIELKNGSKVLYKEKNKYHLIDFSDSSTTNIHLSTKKKDFTSIVFQIGVDSVTTLSGAMGGDLDPTKGMYWTWQSGYIHFKLEGKANNKTLLEYHLGGFQFPNNTVQKIELNTLSKELLIVDLQLDRFVEYAVAKKQYAIMSPGIEANTLVDQLVNCFQIKK